MENKIIIGIVSLLFGLFLLIFYTMSKLKNIIKAIMLKYEKTTGVVIKSINNSSTEYENKKRKELFNKYKHLEKIYEIMPDETDNNNYNGSVYSSVIQYEVNGKKYEIISGFSSDKKEKKNRKYLIRYNPADPSEAFIVNDRGKILVIILIMILIGLGLKLLFL